ncbi:MAG: hypothetical protein KJ970_01270 [Candidatus Eisenbacteria bacterium]|uniref:Uncharacterized protein n=1 Tax=Eiseniibacteriota bacterium TaxID=2212470 RepID=A0A948RV45_UNCEI|nr:hypothetical protein [Candidatus Eisenbacteria bacterium]MBU2689532.1 hypothetical protein [Candidatus Eisenbacteria bacterium]
MSGKRPHRGGMLPSGIGLLFFLLCCTILNCAILLGLTAGPAKAVPRFAMREKVSCSACHVNPTGGGARNEYGAGAYSRHTLARETDRTEVIRHDGLMASGIRIGADFRFRIIYEQGTENGLPANHVGYQVTDADLYGVFEPARDLIFYLRHDPENDEIEAYALLKNIKGPTYLKLGAFSPDFGIRLDDPTAYTRAGDGDDIPNMPGGGLGFGGNDRDAGFELGYERSRWRFSFAYQNGNGATAPVGSSKAQLYRFELRPRLLGLEWIFGLSNYARAGAKRSGYFGGIGLGRLNILGEIDKADRLALGPQTGLAAAHTGIQTAAWMFEASFKIKRGLDFVGRYDLWDSDTLVPGEGYKKIIFGFDYFPMPYLELQPQMRMVQEPNTFAHPNIRNNLILLLVHIWL